MKDYETCKEIGKYKLCIGKTTRNCQREQSDVGFNKDLKVAIINVLKELKETKVKEGKEGLRTMSHQIENISKKTEITKSNQAKMMEVEMYN